jgi:hypothetical protein
MAVNETACVAIVFAASAHPRWLPRLLSKENGTKNFNDAVNHNL